MIRSSKKKAPPTLAFLFGGHGLRVRMLDRVEYFPYYPSKCVRPLFSPVSTRIYNRPPSVVIYISDSILTYSKRRRAKGNEEE